MSQCSYSLLRDVLHFATLHPDDLAVCFGAGVFTVAWFEALKVLRRQRQQSAA